MEEGWESVKVQRTLGRAFAHAAADGAKRDGAASLCSLTEGSAPSAVLGQWNGRPSFWGGDGSSLGRHSRVWEEKLFQHWPAGRSNRLERGLWSESVGLGVNWAALRWARMRRGELRAEPIPQTHMCVCSTFVGE